MSHVQRLLSRVEETILPLVGDEAPARQIMLVDPPDYANVGDASILLGEVAFLRRACPGARIAVVAHNTYVADIDEEIERAGILLFQGGGNFGDIWPHHHEFRLRIIERFAHKPMLQFPQSIHFREDDLLEQTRRTIAKAKRFVFLARDWKTHDFAARTFDCEVELCPDMAFAMGPLEARAPAVDYSCLLRTDKELLDVKVSAVRAALTKAGATFEINDWIERQLLTEKVYKAARMMVRKGPPAVMAARHGLRAFELHARSRLKFGLSLLGRGRVVVTDRLHGYILAKLLGRPCYFFDTIYGKLRAFHETWLADDDESRFMKDAAEFCRALETTPAMGT